jgi:adenylate kinase family enzyme
MKIHIMGASCAGSTTLGMALAQHFNCTLFDSDKYFWEPSEPPFTIKRDPELRNTTIANDVAKHQDWILSGSVINWGNVWLNMFDLVVFLYIPHNIRIQRLKNREIERYGDSLFTNLKQNSIYNAFVQWASGYDDNTTNGRNLQAHENWLSKLSCPVLEIKGDTSVDERAQMVINKVKELDNKKSHR